MCSLLKVVFVILLFMVYYEHSLSQDLCDPASGPTGVSCVYVPPYESAQLATCTTSSNIMSATNNSFQCADSCRDYCWFPCMAEKYGAVNGSISAECQCSFDLNWCYRNTGSDAFYSFCLNNFHNCTLQRFAGYAMFLSLGLSSFLTNSTENCTGKEWIRDFRVCVQRLVTQDILSNMTVTCDDIDTRGFEILENCMSGVCQQTSSEFRNPLLYNMLDMAGNNMESGLKSQYVPGLQNITQSCTTS